MTTVPFEEDSSPVETDVVTIWHGSTSDIPDGWVLADGNNGSPNLLDRIPKGNPDYVTSNGTGGTDSKTLSSSQMAEHDHSTSVDSGGAHAHGAGDYAVESGACTPPYSIGTADVSTGYNTSSNGSHSHSSSSTELTGSGAAIDNRPKSTEVLYIYKV